MSKQVGCTPTSSIRGLSYTYSSMCIHMLHANPYSSHHIYHMAFSRLWLSSLMWAFHTFLSSSSTIFLFRRLGVNFLAHAHPMHECSKYQKGVDQFDLYLASGLGTSPDKIPKETKCDTLVDTILNNKKISLSYFSIPLVACKHHLETFESRTARALAPFVLLLLVSMLIYTLDC